MNTPAPISVYNLPPNLDKLDNVREVFELFLSDVGLGNEEIVMWKLVFTEAVTNAIEHGSGDDPKNRVRIEWWKENDSIGLGVQDNGKGPSDEIINSPDLPDDIFSSTGRGLFIIHQFCPNWEHWKGRQGYRIVLKKEYIHLNNPTLGKKELDSTLDELSACYESLSAFYRLGSNLVSTENLGEFINQSLDTLLESHNFDFGLIVLGDELQVNTIREFEDFSRIVLLENAPLVTQKVMIDGDEFTWERAQEVGMDPLLKNLFCGCCMPIHGAGKLLGTLIVGRKNEGQLLKSSDLNSTRTFSDLFGIAFANQDLQIVRFREQRALRELEIAAEIHQKLLVVTEQPHSDQWELLLRHQSAREVAGDMVEASLDGEGNLLMAVIDVMGKGVSAAFMTAIFRTALHMNLKTPMPLNDLATAISAALCRELGEMIMFVTCTLVRVNKEATLLEIVNAGHCSTLVYREGKEIMEVEPSGPPLGLYPEIEYEVLEVPLKGNESLLAITDGLYEWNQGKGIFGWENFRELARKELHKSPARFWETLQGFIGKDFDEKEREDDQTLLFWKMK